MPPSSRSKIESTRPFNIVGGATKGLMVPDLQPDSVQRSHFLTLGKYIPNGADNQLPYLIAKIARTSPVHRGIINKKVEFIAGAKWTTENEELAAFLHEVNADGESLTQVLKKVAYDELLGGYAFFEVVTDAKRRFLNIYHHDFTTGRLHSDKKGVGIKADWRQHWMGSHKANEAIRDLPLWPMFQKGEDGFLHSMLMIKSYEPEFYNYGIPDWIAGMNVAVIGYKTDKWNLSRLDNAFQPSGAFVLNGVDDDEQAMETKEMLEDEFSGEGAAGRVVFLVGDAEGDTAKFVPFNIKHDADWDKLDANAISKLIAAHSWYRSLMSLPDSTGFETERILNEWSMANKSTILPKQEEYLKPFKNVIETILGLDCSDLEFINRPPVKENKPPYMKVWEARRADGLEYDPDDPTQQMYLAEMTASRGNTNFNRD